ncbi:MAG: hypothetical protein WCD53_07965 [Microcoleus sp.]
MTLWEFGERCGNGCQGLVTYWRQWAIPHGIAGFHGLFDESGEGWAIVENRYTADSTFMKDTARSIYPRRRDTNAWSPTS